MTATNPPPVPHRSAPAAPTHLRAGSRFPRIQNPGRGPEGERGSLMLYMVPIAFVLLMFAGLVFDGGTTLAARGRAPDVAAQAARAAANALDPTSLRTGNPVVLRVDPSAAQAAGQRVLTAAGATGTVTVHGTDVVIVTAHVPARTAILSAIGIRDASGTATASATTVRGVTSPRGGP